MTTVSKHNPLGTGNIISVFLKYFSGALFALILNAVYNLTDALFVSWGVGDNAMGGISIVFPFVLIQGAISTAIGSGAASLVARKMGENKETEAGNITFNAIITFIITALSITIISLIFLNPILKFMGVNNDLLPYAKKYFTVILLGNVFSTGFSSIIRAEGKLKYGILIWVIPISLNIILDALFILVFKWGVVGSAAGTVLSQLTSFTMSMFFFKKLTSQKFINIKLKISSIKEILALGLPALIQMGSLSVTTLLINNMLKSLHGTLAINSFAYVSKIITFAIIPFTALTQAIPPIIGYNFGQKNHIRIKKTLSLSCFAGLIYSILAFAVLFLFPKQLTSIFTNNSEIINYSIESIRILAFSLIFIPFPMIIGSAYQSIGKKLIALIIFASNMLFLLMSIFILAKIFDTKGIYYSYVLSYFLSFVISLLAIIDFTKRFANIKKDFVS